MPDRIVLDSSVIAAFLNKNDSLFSETEKFFQQTPSGMYEIVIPTLVVCEVLNVLGRHTKAAAVTGIIPYLEAFTWVDLDREEVISLTPHFQKFTLKTSDSIVAATALRYQAILITWDDRLLRESRKHLPSFTPSEFMRKIRP